MANYLQAPTLIHKGKKLKGNTIYWQLPQDLMAYVFNELDTKSGAQIKLMCLLLGTAGNGSFSVSEKFVTDTCNISEQGYKTARKALVNRGWITHDTKNQKIIVNIDMMYKAIEEKAKEEKEKNNVSYETNDGDNSDIPIEDNSIIPIEDNSVIPKGINQLSHNIEDIEYNKEDNKEMAATPHRGHNPMELIYKGADMEAYAAAKTPREKMKALGF